jgi:hypothetical protein
MASYLCEAIEVITDNGLGVPVSYANSAIGLMSDGHIVHITDRPNIVTATGDSTRIDWAKGVLTRDFGNWTISRNIDFVESGAFETVSDFTVGIKNTSDFRNTLQANGVYLGRRRVKYYRVTSTDGATWNFELRWTGVIDDQPFNERTFTLKCVNTSKDIFGTLPPVPANKVAFPLMPDDSQDKMIPIALGRVARSPMINVSGSGQKTVLNMISDPTYPTGFSVGGPNPIYVTACFSYTPKDTTSPEDSSPGFASLIIATLGKTFVQDELKGKYVNIIAGGVNQSVLIAASARTTTLGGDYFTTLSLADNLDVSTPFKVYFFDKTDTDYWYCEIADYAATLITSTRAISEFIRGRTTPVSLARYVSDGNIFDSIGETVSISSLSNVKFSGYPGLFVAAATSDNGSLVFYSPIPPSKIYVAKQTGFSGLPAVGALAPLLNNGNPSDYYTLTTVTGDSNFQLDLLFDSDAILKQFEELYGLFDLSHEGPCTVVKIVRLYSLDYVGRITDAIVDYRVKTSPVGATFEDIFRLPGSYYNIVRDDSKFFKDKANYNIQSVIGDTKKLAIYNRLRFEMVDLLGGAYTMRLREVGLVGKRSISFSSETVYGSLRGEVYGNTMDGRVTSTDYPDSVVRVLEYLIRNYDETAKAWEAGHTYAAGEFVRGTADTGHVFVCTVAGSSHATTEPTWTDTASATYTDGTVTWKEHHEIPVDTASFDSAAGARGLWLVGRTLTEKKSSLEYYQSLLAQSFLLGVTKADGKVQLKAWLQNTTPLVAFSEANILPGTLSDVTLTPVRRLSNDLLIQYDKNPASGAFNKQIAVTNIDKPAFPGPSDQSSDGTSLGTFSATSVFNFDFISPTWTLTIVTTAPHGRASGDYLSLSGNTQGYNFPATGGDQVLVVDANTIKVSYLTIGPITSPTTSGTLRWHTNFRLKWQDFVAGIANYSTAETIWQQCHNSYLVTRKVNKLPDELGKCEWYFDIYATDANGKYIFSSDGGVTPEYDLGDQHAAAGFAEALANWTAWQKKQLTFETADTSTFSALGLGDCVSFSDAKLTAGVALIGWIHEKTQLPRTGGDRPQMERFRFGLTLYPEALSVYTPPGIIEEHGATDIIDEHSATNIIEEHGA